MYFRKLSLFQQPTSWIVESSAPESFMAIAPPDLIEWVPILLAVEPNFLQSSDLTDLWRKLILSSLVMLYKWLLILVRLIHEADVVPG
jgi:hypothetical protein